MPKKPFVLSLIGTIFLIISGLAFASIFYWLWFFSFYIVGIGGIIILFLLIGSGLMYSNNKNRVTVGSIINLICLGLSVFLG
ncbi:MAG: hypothetical protein FGF51_04495, partial [Candidatus Brockarchaeota archaeon]|nr:hypothetical protein [Candidatus Brockarchaeota archaeon]